MSANKVNFAYLRAFHISGDLCTHIDMHIDVQYPDWDLNKAPDHDTVFAEANRLLSGNASGVPMAYVLSALASGIQQVLQWYNLPQIKPEDLAVSVGACGSMDFAWTGAPVARICVLSKFVARDSRPST
jgi:hypothetical protein